MHGWYVWQFFAAINPLIFYGTFLYALLWSEVTGYNKLREDAIFNQTGVDKRFLHEWYVLFVCFLLFFFSIFLIYKLTYLFFFILKGNI